MLYADFVSLQEELTRVEDRLIKCRHQLEAAKVKGNQREINYCLEDEKLFSDKKILIEEHIAHYLDLVTKEHEFFERIPHVLKSVFIYPPFDNDLLAITERKIDEITKDDLPKNADQALILLMLSYPGKSVADYREALKKRKLEANDREICYMSIAFNRYDLLKMFKKQVDPEQWDAMMAHDGYGLLRLACEMGNLKMIEWLISKATATQKPEMIAQAAHHYTDFNQACARRDFTMMKNILDQANDLAPDRKMSLITQFDYLVFQEACKSGDLDVMKWLVAQDMSDKQRIEMLTVKHGIALRLALINNRVDILEWLTTQLTDKQIAEIITADNYTCIISALETGSIQAVQWFQQRATEEQLAELRLENNYCRPFLAIALSQEARLARKKLLEQATPEQKAAMLAAHNYEVFRAACVDSDLDLLRWLLEQATPEQRTKMIAVNNYNLLRLTSRSSDASHMMKLFLSNPDCLAFAEKKVKYKEFVDTFLQEAMIDLHEEYKNNFATHPDAVFTTSEEKAHDCYYILRSLIRRNDRALDQEIEFLLTIPSIRNVASDHSNELLEIARAASNQNAFWRLLSIPAVAVLDEQISDKKKAIRQEHFNKEIVKKKVKIWAIDELNSRVDTMTDLEVSIIFTALSEPAAGESRALHCLRQVGISEAGKAEFKALADEYGPAFNMGKKLQDAVDSAFARESLDMPDMKTAEEVETSSSRDSEVSLASNYNVGDDDNVDSELANLTSPVSNYDFEENLDSEMANLTSPVNNDYLSEEESYSTVDDVNTSPEIKSPVSASQATNDSYYTVDGIDSPAAGDDRKWGERSSVIQYKELIKKELERQRDQIINNSHPFSEATTPQGRPGLFARSAANQAVFTAAASPKTPSTPTSGKK